MPYEMDGMGAYPHLSEMTDVAIDILSNDPDGFFLMVEGGLIDVACAGSDLARTIPEVLEFETAVDVAMDWAAGRDDTLILVLGDHETGGLWVKAETPEGTLPTVAWTSGGQHTAAFAASAARAHPSQERPRSISSRIGRSSFMIATMCRDLLST